MQSDRVANQEWFEMKLARQRTLASAVWLPLRAMEEVEKVGKDGFVGFKEEFFEASTFAVPLESRDAVNQLDWGNVGIGHQHQPYVLDGKYMASDVYDGGDEFQGLHLVLEQRVNSLEETEWHLHQDFVLALGLKREGDVWVSPNEDYRAVVRLRRHSDGSLAAIEARAEHLRDYLCARGMALYIKSYRSRRVVVESAGHIKWPSTSVSESQHGDLWEGSVSAIHEGGHPFGSKIGVFHIARTATNSEEDVPNLGRPSDDGIQSRSWEVALEGRELVRIKGALWRNEWVEPARQSPRVRGDRIPSSVFFVADAEGKRESSDQLKAGGRWLWFRPDVMMALCHRRGGSLNWYTQDTGSVCCSPDYAVRFGMNRLGLINVYAKDIALLPEWQQRIWAGHNISPEGGVSEELLASQVRAEPSGTQAPEAFLSKGISLFRQLSIEKLGVSLLREHEDIPGILLRSHRFRAIDKGGLLALAKDLARLTADSIDAAAIHKLITLPKDTKPGSLKSLEQLLSTRVASAFAKQLLSALVGIYELRHSDAHLPSSEIEGAFRLAGIDRNTPIVYQGYQLLHACVSSLYGISSVIRDWDSQTE